MISKLEWDSNCFGYPVGKIVVDDPQDLTFAELSRLSKEYKLIYLFTKKELTVSSDNLFLADRKVTLTRKTEPLSDQYECIEPYYGKVTDNLLKLTLQSGLYSRFNVDKSFVENEYRKLYTEWIENSVNRKIARDVFVYGNDDDIHGFITLSAKANISEIGLVAVDQQSRGKGIGSLLTRYVISQAWAARYPEIQVVTQFDNRAALNLYNKNEFQLSDITYVYHYWNK